MASATAKQQKPSPAIPRPSSSVILVSPRHEILLLHRVKTSTSFASAHVFPGGNLASQDGPCPPAEDLKRHEDGPWYRNAAIRELFEESGILLAKDAVSGKMLSVPEDLREKGRRAIHQNQIAFAEWLKQQNPNAVPDTDQLIPFTRWITPATNTRRYTTQMYLYFLPLPADAEAATPVLDEVPSEGQREEIHIPTSDGGVEVTEARFLAASEWLRLAQSGEIILFPPQFLLLHLVAGFLDKEPRGVESVQELRRRRAELVEFVHSGQPTWAEKCISPKMLRIASDGRTVLALDQPGPELRGTAKQGETERVVLVKFAKGEARNLEVRWKKDAFGEKGRI
ncbi:NUDIX hydrolase [Aspergillus saccharolyticus JOP 1030-1]|uniref:Putative NUDIX family hydrolase n=1 Tax=Aspergillus saccharolyticus JOP 1030-1 TaxID=1450539 RepID=A0A318ZR31_9EURO|nr:putative NUDIX family hydrolase [Aspergillus saccharolyticus JOP 1030-1]PYH49105.1 putative NUDIX family hydrolase [Aspergillus saccharolyticus JOP 1030-1]